VSKFQSPCTTKTKRADCRVQTSKHWRLEQTREELVLVQDSGLKNSFGFYLGTSKKRNTPWFMQEFTSDRDKGAGRKGMPALHKLYVTRRATDDDLREVYGEDGVTGTRSLSWYTILPAPPRYCRRGVPVVSGKSTLSCHRRRSLRLFFITMTTANSSWLT
jgi:hypothetical protein